VLRPNLQALILPEYNYNFSILLTNPANYTKTEPFLILIPSLYNEQTPPGNRINPYLHGFCDNVRVSQLCLWTWSERLWEKTNLRFHCLKSILQEKLLTIARNLGIGTNTKQHLDINDGWTIWNALELYLIATIKIKIKEKKRERERAREREYLVIELLAGEDFSKQATTLFLGISRRFFSWSKKSSLWTGFHPKASLLTPAEKRWGL